MEGTPDGGLDAQADTNCDTNRFGLRPPGLDIVDRSPIQAHGRGHQRTLAPKAGDAKPLDYPVPAS